VFQERISLLL